MARPSKFTADRKTEILRALKLGASLQTAAACGGIGKATLTEWLQRGRGGPADSAYRKFAEDVAAAQAVPNVRALEIVNKAMVDKPDLAWKFLERREGGFAPPQPTAPAPTAGPVTIQLSFAAGGRPQLVPNEAGELEGEVIELEPHDVTDAASSD